MSPRMGTRPTCDTVRVTLRLSVKKQLRVVRTCLKLSSCPEALDLWTSTPSVRPSVFLKPALPSVDLKPAPSSGASSL